VRLRLAVLVLALVAVLAPLTGGAAVASRPLIINVLSGRADLISGGDALVSVRVPSGVRADRVRVFLGSRDVTRRFAKRPDGSFAGLVRGLRVGANTLRAVAPGYAGQRTIINHPNGGPLFSGPQTRHYVCQDGARDRQCNQPATYSFLYRSTNPLQGGLLPYDPKHPASDVAMTTTDRGVSVPFIVRREDGFQDRDRYSIMTLFRPGHGWQPWAPQRQWTHKVLIPHGGNCGASYGPGSVPLDDYSGTIPAIPGYDMTWVAALSRGFAVVATALDNTGHNCNVSTEAESLVMAKERLVERYGRVRYTIGTGCSGGSIAQQTIANAYPGIYQGLTTTCSFPDTLTAGVQYAEFHLMRQYFEDPSQWGPGVLWLPTQMAQVEGHIAPIDAIAADELLFKTALNPEHQCPGTRPTVAGNRATLYDDASNPGGVRCSVLDIWKPLTGPRPKSVWTPMEKKAGHGFGGIPLGNVGVQYGLQALKDGQITTDQFVDLNAKLGGLNVDGARSPARSPGDPASIARAYRTGLVNEGNHMQDVAMINYGGPDPGLAHDYSHAWWMQDRLRRSQGSVGNRVMWFGEFPLIGDPSWAVESFTRMDQWLARVEKDHRSVSLASKIVADKPADLVDRCTNLPGIELITGPNSPLCAPVLQTHFGTPRQVAGDDKYNDRLACHLKPLDRSSFGFLQIPLSDAQWATLKGAFPTGVCDYSKPGLGQARAQTWLTYSDASGHVVYGGRNLPGVPPRSAQGWSSPAFRSALRR
jgi:hypothetical protein